MDLNGNAITVANIESVVGNSGADTLTLTDIANTLTASSIESIVGGTVADSIVLSGAVTGAALARMDAPPAAPRKRPPSIITLQRPLLLPFARSPSRNALSAPTAASAFVPATLHAPVGPGRHHQEHD